LGLFSAVTMYELEAASAPRDASSTSDEVSCELCVMTAW